MVLCHRVKLAWVLDVTALPILVDNLFDVLQLVRIITVVIVILNLFVLALYTLLWSRRIMLHFQNLHHTHDHSLRAPRLIIMCHAKSRQHNV